MAVTIISAKFFVLLVATFVCVLVGNFIDWVWTNIRRIVIFHFTSTITEWVIIPGVCKCGGRGPGPFANPTIDIRAFAIREVLTIVSEFPDNLVRVGLGTDIVIVRVGLGARW